MTSIIRLVLAAAVLVSSVLTAGQYNAINGYLCIKSSFTETIPGLAVSDIRCGVYCSDRQSCQAFTIADGPCQLFLFNACSKSVKNCYCTRRGQVFVKQQPELLPGALCPPSYGDDLCGVKYRLVTEGASWQQGYAKCQSESSLVIMSDVVDATEMAQVDSLATKYSQQFWLGGYQKAGSAEPLGGWSWVACNLSIDTTLWGSGEPSVSNENAVFRSSVHQMLADVIETNSLFTLCECMSPFD